MEARRVAAISVVTLWPLLAHAELSRVEERILANVEAGRAGAVDLVRRAVDIQSATENHRGVRRVGELFAVELRTLGFETRWVDLPREVDRAGHLGAFGEQEHASGEFCELARLPLQIQRAALLVYRVTR